MQCLGLELSDLHATFQERLREFVLLLSSLFVLAALGLLALLFLFR